MMDDEVFQYITLIALGVLFISLTITGMTVRQARADIQSGLQCNEVVDMIYEQCQEETNITITTIKGRNTQLEYDRGVCIIK